MNVLTPTQLRMARAACALSVRTLGACVGVSGMAISRYERGDTQVLSVATAARLRHYFETQGLYFGPHEGVCCAVNVFQSDRWIGIACYQLLQEAGQTPSSQDLLAAYARAQGSTTQGAT